MLIIRRLIAYLIDIGIILIYAYLIMEASLWFGMDEKISGPFQGQMIGFFTLTLPVFIYLWLTEQSGFGATLGKAATGIRVVSVRNAKPNFFLRNLLKLLPWEIAHSGIHGMFAAEDVEQLPFYIWVLLIVPQLIALAYLISIISSGGKSSFYDRAASTLIAER